MLLLPSWNPVAASAEAAARGLGGLKFFSLFDPVGRMIKEDKPATGMQQGVPDVFAANVALLMRMYRDPAHATNESPVTSRRLAAPALTRIVRKPRYETVETLELLAEVFRRNVPGLEAWMLLYPNLDPKHLPVCVADHERDLLRRIRTFTAKQPAHIGKVSSDRLQGG